MAMLFEKLNTLEEYGAIVDMPKYIKEGLNPAFELRPYQVNAFRRFITWFQSDKLRRYPAQLLFHMATGSGKTLIMAGLILYLYRQGYRNFLFFVNSTNIIEKTKENFLNAQSSKYLFNDVINIDGEYVRIKEVDNFQSVDENAVNICFTTIQGLHQNLWEARENSMTFEDFIGKRVVLISDEAHHINVDTKKGKRPKDEAVNEQSWEYSVARIFNSDKYNVLLEFTATCDLENPFIKAKYLDKIIFDYPLAKFREDKYSKEVKVLQADIPLMKRALQAVLLSQYRLKLFQTRGIYIKPVVLFKSAKIDDSKAFFKAFAHEMATLNAHKIAEIKDTASSPVISRMFDFFEREGISLEMLAQELKEEFSEDRCIIVNSKEESEEKQIIVNTLEDNKNLCRAVFTVNMLNEGWDVLNLFDIVRLYETRDAKNGKPGKTTIQEAQLIGRGARYCPFRLDAEQDKFKRKFDNDLENEMRVCETLYYHSVYDSKYVAELTTALKETGLLPDNAVEVEYRLKENFKSSQFYKEGLVFANKKREKSRKDVYSLPDSLKNKEFTIQIATGKTQEDIVFEEKHTPIVAKTFFHRKKIVDIEPAVIHKAMRSFDTFKFNVLKSHYPNLKSVNEFVTSSDYLGGIEFVIESADERLTNEHLYVACLQALRRVASVIAGIEVDYEGTKEFYASRINEVFKNKKVYITDPHGDGVGVSQNAGMVSNELRLDLSGKDWFVFDDNYGTSEEKRFIAYFNTIVSDLKKKYEEVYLVRNERQLAIYSFDHGERFEPDYLLFLLKKDFDGMEQYQIFIEPKGGQLLLSDAWKEDLLLQLEKEAVPVKVFVDDNHYKIWGFPFYNAEQRDKEFKAAMARVL